MHSYASRAVVTPAFEEPLSSKSNSRPNDGTRQSENARFHSFLLPLSLGRGQAPVAVALQLVP